MTHRPPYRFPRSALDHTIPARFEMWAREAPDRTAFQQEPHRLSFDALNRWANHLAHTLLDAAGDTPEPVLLLLTAPRHHVAGQLGVLKAGKIGVPLDASFPEARQARILADAEARVIVTERAHRARAATLAQGHQQILLIDDLPEARRDDNPGLALDPTAPAYLIYTSGSTGVPKGVVQTHRNLQHIALLYHRDLGLGPADHVTAPTSFVFAGAIWAVLSTLLNGGTYIATSFDAPHLFAATLQRARVTVAQLNVTLLRHFMGTSSRWDLPALRLIYTGGETMHADDLERFARVFPEGCGLVCSYGSTEAGLITHLQADLAGVREGRSPQHPADPAFPVGYPVEDAEVVVLDAHGAPVPAGQVGEIVIRSDFLAPGYWRDATLTQQHFRADPAGGAQRAYRTGDLGLLRPDGCVIHLGRKDFQVKVRGFRVNLEEIEAALRALDGIAGAAARAVTDAQGTSQIVAYVVPAAAPPSIGTLRRRLAEQVPDFMIPARFVYLDRLPIAPNGKLDRAALPESPRARPALAEAFLAPRTATEAALCTMWTEVLEIDQVGVLDNFLELGGDSLAVMRLLARIRHAWNIDLSPVAVFDAPTTEALAAILEAHSREVPVQTSARSTSSGGRA